MYSFLLSLHSLLRWLLLIFLLYAILRAYYGYYSKSNFGTTDNAIRHWTATIGHVQLIVGMLLYLRSPVVTAFRQQYSTAASAGYPEAGFFGWIHISLMVLAIVVLTIGSAMAKRRPDSRSQYRTMLYWFGAALLIILLAIPWPFAPWAHRPYFRPFT
jgi:hypothetical protein